MTYPHHCVRTVAMIGGQTPLHHPKMYPPKLFFLTRDRSSTKCPLRVHIAGHGSVTGPTLGWKQQRMTTECPVGTRFGTTRALPKSIPCNTAMHSPSPPPACPGTLKVRKTTVRRVPVLRQGSVCARGGGGMAWHRGDGRRQVHPPRCLLVSTPCPSPLPSLGGKKIALRGGGGWHGSPFAQPPPSPSLVTVPGGGFGLGLPYLSCGGGGGSDPNIHGSK